MKLKHQQLAESQPLLRRLSNQEPVVEAEEAETHRQEVVTMLLLAPRPVDVAPGIDPMVVRKVLQLPKIKIKGSMKKAKMVVEWAVALVEVVVLRLLAKLRMRLRATSKRLRKEER